MTEKDSFALGETLGTLTKEYVRAEIAKLETRIAELEQHQQRQPATEEVLLDAGKTFDAAIADLFREALQP